ncbi:MAG TPA: hypothetical protein VHB98_08885, partial [Chloroflexota bacterium]|nr:hypothetical protein [Chloroflexota bacterium]
MRIPNWRSRKTPLARMGAAAFILAAVVPLQHSGTTSASASHVTVINVRPATTIDYVGTEDPAQLSTARTGAALAGTARAARHVVPFLTPHRASTRQQVASGAVPRLAAATVSMASTDTSNLISRSPVGGVSLGGFPSLSAADQFTTHVPLVGANLAGLEPPD